MFDKLERKFGKYAITNFSYYIMIIYIVGAGIGMLNPSIYNNYLALDFDLILSGQVWRLITFIFYPYITSLDFISLLFGAISIYFYYYIGTTLENTWGAFRFNVYYLSGLVLNILATLMIYLIFGVSISFGMTYVQNALFLAFATIMPDNYVRLYFLIPIKMKWMGIVYGVILIYQVITNILTFTPAGFALAAAILISMLNFIVYFANLKKKPKRQKEWEKKNKKMNKKFEKTIDFPAHTCCVCGRNSLTNPELEFRYCSKCDGMYEYCQDHLFTHEHIGKNKKEKE